MDLVLCSTCRLPVHGSLKRCPLCTAPLARESGTRRVSVAAAATAVAAVAAVAVIARLGFVRAATP